MKRLRLREKPKVLKKLKVFIRIMIKIMKPGLFLVLTKGQWDSMSRMMTPSVTFLLDLSSLMVKTLHWELSSMSAVIVKDSGPNGNLRTQA
jgi:hypothetical protein